MSRVLICTLASGWYKKFAPIFEYTAKKHNPDCDVRVFDKDEIFPNHHDSSTALLRFCIPNKYFEGYDYVYIADVDFVFLKHKPSMIHYHINVMRDTGLSYSAYRGKIKHDGKRKWHGRKTRIVAGLVFVSRKWLKKTEKIRAQVCASVINGVPTRERDEIMLYRIMRYSGIKTPKHHRRFYNGERFDKNYRNLHLGDFRTCFKHRWRHASDAKHWWLSNKSVKKYRKLCKDDTYMTLVKEARKEPQIDEMYRNLDWHLEWR